METPPKSGQRLTLAVQNGGGGRYHGVNSIGYGSLGRGATKPGFFASFLVDARGGKMHGKRHSGVDLIIPPSKVCMPTRITCKLIRKEKLIRPPVLKEGEALASRIAELGPVGEKFLGAVLIELPHFASRIDGERELVILRSENGVSWQEHESQTPSETLVKLIENDEEINKDKRVVRIFTADFPRYFVAVTRIRQDSRTIGSSGGTVKSSVSQAVAAFPEGAIGKDTKIGLQVLPIAPETILRVLGQTVVTSAVTTVEPRRRKFRSPVTLTVPVPKEMQDGIRKQKKDENPAVHILYSITGGSAPSQWEDITGSAPLNLVNDSVSFSTVVSARYWLMDCRNLPIPIKAANEVFQDVVTAPFLAKFYFLVKRHSLTEAQVRVLCITDDDIESTLERQERFAIIGNSTDIEVFEGKPYYIDIAGNFKPVAASDQELFVTFHSFRVNRLSFVAHIIDASQPPVAQLFLNKELVVPTGKRAELPLFTLSANLPNFDAGLVSPDLDPERWRAKLEAAKLSLAQDRPPVGAALRLTDIAEALQGDWILLASHLGISPREVVKIQTEFGSAPEQAILMLHLWVEKHGGRVKAIELERALRKIGRDDVVVQCIYDSSDETSEVADDHDSLNPIDSSFIHRDQSAVSEEVQGSKSEIQPGPYVEVEEGVEYQVEEVWDGTQWHKTRIAVKKPPVEPTEPTSHGDLGTNIDDPKTDSIAAEKSEDFDLNFAAIGHLAAVKEEEINFSPSLNTEGVPPLEEVKPSVQVPPAEDSLSGSPSEIGKQDTEPQPRIQSNSNLATENHPDPPLTSHFDSKAEEVKPSVQVPEAEESSSGSPSQIEKQEDAEPQPGIQSNSNLVSENQSEPPLTSHFDSKAEEVKPQVPEAEESPSESPSQIEKQEDAEPQPGIQSNLITENQSEPPATSHSDSLDHPTVADGNAIVENQSVLHGCEEVPHSEPITHMDHTLKTDTQICDLSATSTSRNEVDERNEMDELGPLSPGTVVIETEETLDNSTVVKRTVTKTTEHEDSDDPSTFRNETDGMSDVVTLGDVSVGDPKVTTEVEEFVETLDDGSVVKRKVIKTKQEQLVTEKFAVSGPDGAFRSITTEQVSHQILADGFNSSSPATEVIESEETLDDGTIVKRTVTKTTAAYQD